MEESTKETEQGQMPETEGAETEKEPKPIEESEAKEETKTSEESEAKEETKASEESEAKEETKTSEESEAKEETKTSEESEAKEETKTSEESEAKEESKEESEPAKESKSEVRSEIKTTDSKRGRGTRIKWEITCFICLALFLYVNFLTIKYITAHTKQEVHGVEYREVEQYVFPDCLTKNSDKIEQYFKVQRDGLSRIGIRMAYNHGEYLKNYGASCSLEVTEVESGKILFFEEVTQEDIRNWHYYWIFLDECEKDKEYKLTMKQTGGLKSVDGDYILSWVPFIYSDEQAAVASDDSFPVENLKCEYNGELQSYEFDLEYVYDYADKKQYFYLFLANLVLIGVFGLIYLLAKIKKPLVTYIWAWLLPIPLIVLVEIITGAVFTITPKYWFANYLCFYLIYGCAIMFFRRMKIAVVGVSFLLVALAILQHFVCIFRGRPFMLQDLISARTAAQVAKSYTYELPLEGGIAILGTITLIAGVILLPPMKAKKYMKIRRIASLMCFFEMGVFMMDQDLVAKTDIFHISWWDIEASYSWGGYLRTLLAQVPYMEVQKPDEYTVQKVKEIAERGATEYEMDAPKEDLKSPVNLILIMNESWADLRYINSYDGDDEIMPFIDSLNKNVIKGYLSMPVFGAGTANSEWEVLTGNTMANINSSSVPYQSFIKSQTYSMASKMKQLGFATLAMHPHEPANWDRDKAYKWMDFDEFHSIEEWSTANKEIIRWCVSDSAAYREVEKMYEEKEPGKWFTFLVTMQNHGGYDLEYDSSVNLAMRGSYPQAEQYLSLIKKSDEAFEELVEYFSKVKEPTIIAMFGDHLPNIEQDFYSEMFGMEWDDIDKRTMRKIYVTPYIVWANYALDIDDTTGDEVQTAYGVNGPEMSSNYFGSYLMKWAGLPLSEYDEYLLNMHKKIPVYGNGMMRDNNGKWYYYGGLPDDMQKIKDEYNMLQYNNMFDKRQRVDSIFSIQAQGN